MEKNFVTEEMISAFARYLQEEERSEATIKKYIHDVKIFTQFLGERELGKDALLEYKVTIRQKYSPSSVNSMLVAVNQFMKVMGHPEYTVKTLRIQNQSFRSEDKELTKAEYLRLLDTARKRKRCRLMMLMQTICATGIRVSELPYITVEAARTGRAIVTLKGKTRQVLLPATLCRVLKKYAKSKGISKGSIFITRNGKALDRSNILHAMKALCKEAGVDARKVFPHNLRHLFACLYYKASKDISRLADMLGHSSINTTRIYTSVNGSEQQREIEKLGLVIKNTT